MGEETIAQTSTSEKSGPLGTKWPVSMAPPSTPPTTCSFHTQLLSVSFSYPLFSTALCFFLFCFRLFYAYEFVEDDVGEGTIAHVYY